MKCLLDTHTVLWFFDYVEKLPKAVFDAILDPENEKYVSIASVWELAIKILILVASAMVENMSLITVDTNIRHYDVAQLW